MLKIDLHTHILPENWPNLREKYGYGEWIRLEHHAPCRARMLKGDTFFREVESNCWDGATRTKEMDDTGVHVQVLSTVPVMFSYWAKPEDALDLSRLLNDHIAGVVARYPRRFVGLATIPMQSPALAIRELERCVKELGLAGVQIGTNVNGRNLNHPEVVEVLAAAQDLGAAVFVHPWDMLGQDRTAEYWMSWLVGMPAETALAMCSLLFGGVLDKLPRLRICFAHGGGSFPGTIGRIDHGAVARPDLVLKDSPHGPRHYLGRFFVDSLVHDADALRGLVRLFGAARVALGSDYPFPLGEEHPGRLIESLQVELGEEATASLLHGAALEFLNIPKGRFLDR